MSILHYGDIIEQAYCNYVSTQAGCLDIYIKADECNNCLYMSI